MASYIISYDLMAPGKDYAALHKAIKELGSWAKVLESTWVIKHSGPASSIRDELTKHVDKNDKLFVAKLSGEGAWKSLGAELDDWLVKNL